MFRIILIVYQGSPLAVSAGKVVAGLEPENTNLFLLALAEVATDSNIDYAAALARHQAGEVAGQGAIPTKRVRSIFYISCLY